MGGDCCHFAGMFRPSQSVPLPGLLEDVGLDPYYPNPCPCSTFTAHHPAERSGDAGSQYASRISPFYNVSESPGSAYADAASAQRSITKLQDLDAHPGIFICLAHDNILFDILPIFNRDPRGTINDWRERGFKEMARWSFLNDLPKGDGPGREPFIVGKWRDAEEVTWSAELGFTPVIRGNHSEMQQR